MHTYVIPELLKTYLPRPSGSPLLFVGPSYLSRWLWMRVVSIYRHIFIEVGCDSDASWAYEHNIISNRFSYLPVAIWICDHVFFWVFVLIQKRILSFCGRLILFYCWDFGSRLKKRHLLTRRRNNFLFNKIYFLVTRYVRAKINVVFGLNDFEFRESHSA